MSGIGRILVLAVAAATGASAQIGGFGGPSILSRAGGRAGRVGGEFARVRLHASLQGIYDSALTGVILNQDGRIASAALAGVEGIVGAYGGRSWKRQAVGVNYTGAYRHYNQNSFFNGTNQTLALDYSNQVARKWTVGSVVAAGILTQAFGAALSNGMFIDPGLVGVPTRDFFDNRVIFLQTMGTATYVRNPRMSFHFQGGGFAVERRSSALFGVRGAQAGADVAYRLARRTTLSTNYMYLKFNFPRAFGGADIHSVMVAVGHQIGRRWQLSLGVGGFRVESLGTRIVELDPVIAELLGQTRGVEAFYSVGYLPNYNATLSGNFRKSGISFTYMRGAFPGNGVLLTSVIESVGTQYTYNGFGRWSLYAGATYFRMKGVAGVAGTFDTYGFNGGFARSLRRDLHFTARLDWRQFGTTALNGFRRNGVGVGVGLTYSPGEFPVSFW